MPLKPWCMACVRGGRGVQVGSLPKDGVAQSACTPDNGAHCHLDFRRCWGLLPVSVNQPQRLAPLLPSYMMAPAWTEACVDVVAVEPETDAVWFDSGTGQSSQWAEHPAWVTAADAAVHATRSQPCCVWGQALWGELWELGHQGTCWPP